MRKAFIVLAIGLGLSSVAIFGQDGTPDRTTSGKVESPTSSTPLVVNPFGNAREGDWSACVVDSSVPASGLFALTLDAKDATRSTTIE